uniref:Uncharacterized protein n=1 Tax=Periophthalmus magnuspinnatus TaxID=409849 RepID=A0A3B4AB97_9GOBI
EAPGYSPSFKRPAEIMRMRRKRARSEAGSLSGSPAAASPGQGASSPAWVRPFSPGPLFNSQNRSGGGGGGVKRRNPFANIENTYSPSKKLIIYNEEEERVEAKEKKETGQVSTKKTEVIPFSPPAIAPASIAPPVCTEYPADWSLKTRVLFTSPLSLSWAEKPKAQEEAVGLSQHCRAQYISPPHSIQDAKSCSELRCSFQQSLVYWQHPSLFTKSAPWSQDAVEFSHGNILFIQLLNISVITQFTVLFKAAGLSGSNSITALISPTTRGLREAMKAEGIEFSLPLTKSADEDDDDNDNDEDEDMSWLKEMGVQDKIKKPDSISVQLRKEGQTTSLDHKPESVVLVEGPDTFTLINFLINCKSVVASAGSQAGLPPTLLSPVAFRGAAMHTLKSSSSAVDLSSCGLLSASVQQLQTPSTLGKTALNHLNMNNYSYTWKN